MSDDDVRSRFGTAVNMTAGELEKWLQRDESKAVGQKKGGAGESTGHESGRRIVAILRTKKADLSDDDEAHMRKVVGYVDRHTAQGGRHRHAVAVLADELGPRPAEVTVRR